ncbi:MAG: NUDIX domain-containing protein [Candidatus Moranbacteria bacterium]|nr:NUDIX domain-containing protein [Candidatus Moranbacteria bacterium]
MREDRRELIETHVGTVCFRETDAGIRILIAKRQSTRSLYPGLWECGGGQVRSGENFDEAVRRQTREEFGIEIGDAVPFSTYEIAVPDLPQRKIPGVLFACFCEPGDGGNAVSVCDIREHSECRWQSIDDLSGFDFIPGIREDIREGLEVYSRRMDRVHNR